MSDHVLIVGQNTFDLFEKVKRRLGQPNDSIAVAELCISYLRSNIGHPAREEPSGRAEDHTSLETGLNPLSQKKHRKRST